MFIDKIDDQSNLSSTLSPFQWLSSTTRLNSSSLSPSFSCRSCMFFRRWSYSFAICRFFSSYLSLYLPISRLVFSFSLAIMLILRRRSFSVRWQWDRIYCSLDYSYYEAYYLLSMEAVVCTCTSSCVFLILLVRLAIVDLLFLSSDISESSSISFFSRQSSCFSISQCFLVQAISSSSSSESSLCRITSMIFMEQSFTSSIFLFELSKDFRRLSSRSRMVGLQYSNLSFLKLQSRLQRSSRLLLENSSKGRGCSMAVSSSERSLMLPLQRAYSWINDSVLSINLSASFWVYFQSRSIFFLNYFISFSFLSTSTAYPTYRPTSVKGVFSSRSVRKTTSSRESTLMEWSRCSFLQTPQKTLKECGQQRFMQMKAFPPTLEAVFSILLCLLQRRKDIISNYYRRRKMGEGRKGEARGRMGLNYYFCQQSIRCMKEEHYEVADLTSLIKGRQSVTPKNSESNGRPVRSEGRQADSDYQSNKSQYTTNYQTSNPQAPKNQKAYRQQINFTKYDSPQGQFIAYCIVVKQSNLGIYSHERLLVLDSYLKELKYFSEIPSLPITRVDSLISPKEVVSILTAKKFSYVPVKNGIGEVVVSWMDGTGMKEWKLTMSSRRIAKDFGALIDLIRNSEHLVKKEQSMMKKTGSATIENKVNKKETPFIAEIKRLEENTLKAGKEEGNKDEIVNIDSEITFSNTPFEKYKEERVEAENNRIEEAQQQPSPTFILPDNKEQPIPEKKQQEDIKVEPQPQPQIQAQPIPIPLPQIKFQQIIKQADKQHSTILQIKSPKSQNKRFYELQNILNDRLSKEKQHRSSINSHNGHRLSENKAVVKKIEKNPDESLRSSRNGNQTAEPKTQSKAVTARRQSRYEENYNSFRLSLLEERRQKVNDQKGKVSIIREQPKRQSGRSRSTSMDAPQIDNWLLRWLFANTRDDLCTIYSSFTQQCQTRVKKLSQRFDNWHLFHKNGQEFHFEESDIEFTYFIFRENGEREALLRKEQDMERRIMNWSYLLGFVRKEIVGQRFAVPLACMVQYKGLKVFCKASFNSCKGLSSIVQNISEYLLPLRELESACKIALDRSELYELILKDTKFLYFNELDALPKVGEGQWIDHNYISSYIQQGVVRNQFDIEQISKHIKGKLFSRLLKKLNNSYLLTSVQFQEMMNELGLNDSFVGEMYSSSKDKQYQQAILLLKSEIIATGLAQAVRMSIHRFLLKQHSGDIERSIFSALQLFIEGNLLFLEEINLILKQLFNQLDVDYKECLHSYVIASALLKLSLRCQFLHKMPFDRLENLSLDIWSEIPFNPSNMNLHAVCDTLAYSYQHFVSSPLLSTIFSKPISFPEGITSDKVIAQLGSDRSPYPSCSKFKLMPRPLKIKFNYYLAHFSPPANRNLGLSFEAEHSQVYFNLYQHSTVCMQTQQSFSEDLIGIKWLIKRGKYEQADSKLQQQRQRVWIWARHHPRILLQLYDVQSLYAQKKGRLGIAIERSLTSLQLAIHFYGNRSDRTWQVIWEKAFAAAELHYQVHGFERAGELYEICSELSEKMRGEELGREEVNEQFLEVYNRQAMILLTEGMVGECLEGLERAVQRLKGWREYFSGEKLRLNILIKVQSQLYDSYRLMLRCWEIKSNFTEYHRVLTILLHTYFQKDWTPTYLSNPKFKLTDQAKGRISELVKSAWLYVLGNCEQVNRQLLSKGEAVINLRIVKVYLQQIRQQNHGYYRYTSQQLFKFIVELVVSEQPPQPDASSLLSLLTGCLSSLSHNDLKHSRCKLYDEHSKSNKLLFLQAVTHLATYEYCIGTIQLSLQEFSFSF